MMKLLLTILGIGLSACALSADQSTRADKPMVNPKPPVFTAPGSQAQPSAPSPVAVPPQVVSAPTAGPVHVQQPVESLPALVSAQQAQHILNRFQTNYARLGSPRIVLYVNRELVDERTGLKLASRTEKTHSQYRAGPAGGGQGGQSAANLERVTGENKYELRTNVEPRIADRQTIRDVERLFGRPLRIAGAHLADQRVAAQLIADKPVTRFATPSDNDQSRRDREALMKIADVAIEVLISSRQVTVTEVSGERTYTVPEIQATAIQLKDAKILGQAISADMVGKGQAAARAARTYDVREMTEATALSLMEDMLLGLP